MKNINFFKGELSQANIGMNSFDIVIMNNFIEHVNNPSDVLASVHKLLRKGGRLIGEVPNGASFGHRFWKSYWGPLHTPRHLYIFNKRNLVKLFYKNGFSNIKISYTYRPSGWAKSMKNILVRGGFMEPSGHTSKIYPLLILINVPFFIGEYLFKNSSIMKFIAEK
jgi:SAM-dependent methyltransferase